MAAVQQRVLNWLYSVLTSEYQDVNRTYNDVAQALSHYSSLNPRTEVYTYENGTSALLLQLSGTIPVVFRGSTYRFPIALWIPHAYPRQSPIVYVTPTEGMVVRAGQHVDPQGKVYHPYLVGWAEFWDKSSIVDFLAILRDVFAKEPPVVARPQRNQPPNSPRPASIPPPVPPLPPDIAGPSSKSPTQAIGPPPPPPKSYESPPTQPPSSSQSGPPLPPLPPVSSKPSSHQPPPLPPQIPPNQFHQPLHSSKLKYESPPPLPQPTSHQGPQYSNYGSPSRVDPYRDQRISQNQPLAPYGPGSPQLNVSHTAPNTSPSYIPHQSNQPLPTQRWPLQPQVPQQTKPKAPLMNIIDAPLTLSISPKDQVPIPAPPIPPNPEKDLLLSNLATTLYNQRQQHVTRTTSLLPSLASQHTAMLGALSNMHAEHEALSSLSALLTSNTTILHNALHAADAVIENSQHRAAPKIDEILVAPTVVGNQLYELVSEERSLADAIFVVGRAVERGRVAPAVFVKVTRGLAREWFLKKALVRKVARGMGLAGVANMGGGREIDGWRAWNE